MAKIFSHCLYKRGPVERRFLYLSDRVANRRRPRFPQSLRGVAGAILTRLWVKDAGYFCHLRGLGGRFGDFGGVAAYPPQPSTSAADFPHARNDAVGTATGTSISFADRQSCPDGEECAITLGMLGPSRFIKR